ncbi:HlyD family secretion protein [Marinimicrobium sp. ARAG 43.8]|uniref:HlyD family secretion protein n=1 Tax=Marinimicrobium sp. ARAG 43.8 TaxID=3418719 RepID=UPI003CECD1B3
MTQVLRSIATYITLLIGALGVAIVLYAWDLPPFNGSEQTTDDAYVRGQVILISPQLSGYLVDVPVQDYQHVREGDLIAKVDDRTYRQKLAQAKAQLAKAEAALANSEQSRQSAQARIESALAAVDSAKARRDETKTQYQRVHALRDTNMASQSEEEKAKANSDQAQAALRQAEAAVQVARQELNTIVVSRRSLEASVDSAQADVELAKIDWQNTRITAPQDGTLGEVSAQIGQYVSAGSRLASIIPRQTWVVANFKETQLRGMVDGQAVNFTVDALGDHRFAGHIESFAPATGSEFSVIKADNATGNFTKVAQRLAVRIAIDPDQPMAEQLVPGLSVVVHADTNALKGTRPNGTRSTAGLLR